MQISSIIFSTSVVNGSPVDVTTVFPSDIAEIFCTFTLTGDLCCSYVDVVWQLNDETVFLWGDIGTGIPATNTVSMVMPDGGFAKGEYHVQVSVNFIELVSSTFIVE